MAKGGKPDRHLILFFFVWSAPKGHEGAPQGAPSPTDTLLYFFGENAKTKNNETDTEKRLTAEIRSALKGRDRRAVRRAKRAHKKTLL